MISLARRLTLLVIALLCLCCAVAGFTFYESMRQAREMELSRRLDIRLAWLGAAISVSGVEGGQIKLHKRREPEDAARFWRIDTADGKTLWQSENWREGHALVARSRVLVYGPEKLPALPGRYIVPREELIWARVPAAVREAAERAVPGLVADQVERAMDRGEVIYNIDGRGEHKECVLTIHESGLVRDVAWGNDIDSDSVSLTPRYRLTGKLGRIELKLTARTSSAAMDYALARVAWGLKVIGPLALVLTGALAAALIRWQLRPLTRMAEQAGRIGPVSFNDRIGPVGSSTECVQLREAINGMLDRLAEGLEREHRFASTAAHELRTPLAQLRTTIEVALRRERDSAEYRAALVDTLADVERLQKLVLGLLQLARSGEHSATARGRPIALASLLQKAGAEHGPFLTAHGGNGEELAVDGDADLFLSALGNVLENAAHYAPGTPPTVRIDEDEDSVRLIVADRGPGVPEADRERVFQPLTRLEPVHGEAEPADGFGLGLTVARAAARAYGGDLTCQGRADGAPGAEFVFRFRRAASREC